MDILVAAVSAALAAWWWVPPAGLGRLAEPWGRALVGRVARATAWGGWIRSRWRARGGAAREAVVRAAVPQVCDLLAVCLDAGRPPRSALRVVAGVLEGPVAEELSRVLQRIDLGVDEAEAWAGLGTVPGFRAVGRDLARSVRSGVGLAELLRQHATDARKDAAATALVRARAAGVKSVVPLMVCFLPAFLLLGIVPMFGAFAASLGG